MLSVLAPPLQISVQAPGAAFECLSIHSVCLDSVLPAVEVVGGGSSLRMHSCSVEEERWGRRDGSSGCVAVRGKGHLTAEGCSFSAKGQRGTGTGVRVGGGGVASLAASHVKGFLYGWWVKGEGSRLTAAGGSSACGNTGDNARVQDGGAAVIEGCTLDGSIGDNGLCVIGEGSTATATATSICCNNGSNVFLFSGGTVALSGACRCDGSKQGYGWDVRDAGSRLVVDARSCTAAGNAKGAVREANGGTLVEE